MPEQFTLLLEWRRNEAVGRALAKLPHDFYSTTTTYLADVRRSYEADLRENPSGRKGEISRQTYQRAAQVARDIVEGRMQKVLTAAFQASIGGPRDLPNALPEERAVFDRILATLLDHGRSAAPYLEPVGPPAPGATASVPRPAEPAPPSKVPVNPPPGGDRPARAPTALVYVRVLENGRPIQVGASTVDLRKDDVLSLPPETAKLLIDAKVAEAVTPAAPPTVT
jgi:DNA replication initiation complex subunit (GINS family)